MQSRGAPSSRNGLRAPNIIGGANCALSARGASRAWGARLLEIFGADQLANRAIEAGSAAAGPMQGNQGLSAAWLGVDAWVPTHGQSKSEQGQGLGLSSRLMGDLADAGQAGRRQLPEAPRRPPFGRPLDRMGVASGRPENLTFRPQPGLLSWMIRIAEGRLSPSGRMGSGARTRATGPKARSARGAAPVRTRIGVWGQSGFPAVQGERIRRGYAAEAVHVNVA